MYKYYYKNSKVIWLYKNKKTSLRLNQVITFHTLKKLRKTNCKTIKENNIFLKNTLYSLSLNGIEIGVTTRKFVVFYKCI